MARLIGIDLRSNAIRVAVIRTTYRAVTLEMLFEVDTKSHETLDDAFRMAIAPHLTSGDSIAISLDGERAFVRRVALPASASKQIDEVLPFELEALLPVEFEELTFDYRKLPQTEAGGEIATLAVAARREDIDEKVHQVEKMLGRQPERVGAGALPLANLVQLSPELKVDGPVAVVDFGQATTDAVVLEKGTPVYARTASLGISGLPQTAEKLVGVLRQTFGALALQGTRLPTKIYLTGGGATAPGAAAYLSHELETPCEILPRLLVEARAREYLEQAPQFAKAIGIALGLRPQARDLDLRHDEHSLQRSYGFLKQKLPVIGPCVGLFLLSFLFSTWAESRALGRENSVLSGALEKLTGALLGEPTSQAELANELLDRGGSPLETDPRPQVDAFDVLVALAEAVPEGMVHDVDELELARNQVKIVGVVGTTKEAEAIAETMKGRPCFQGVKITRITQALNSERQKYIMEFEVKCESAERKKAEAPPASSEAEPEVP